MIIFTGKGQTISDKAIYTERNKFKNIQLCWDLEMLKIL